MLTYFQTCQNILVFQTIFIIIAEEMDWDKNGMVNFKEFLFAFTRWVGLDEEDEDDDEGEKN